MIGCVVACVVGCVAGCVADCVDEVVLFGSTGTSANAPGPTSIRTTFFDTPRWLVAVMVRVIRLRGHEMSVLS